MRKKVSSNQEKNIAKALKGKTVAGSGSTPFNKGDVVLKNFLIEAKTQLTEKESFTIQKKWFEKLKLEAFAMRKPYRAISFNFGGLENTQNFYIIDEELFKALVFYLDNE